jgi:hypothetical protein
MIDINYMRLADAANVSRSVGVNSALARAGDRAQHQIT